MNANPAGGGAIATPIDMASYGPDLFSLHCAGGITVHAGANAARIVGPGADRLLADGYLSMVHVSDRVAVAKAFDDCMAECRPTSARFRVTCDAQGRPAGATRWFEIRCQPAPAEIATTRQGACVLAVTRDVSDLHRMEEELRANREKAESASVAKGLFLATMSHELRTPLNAILGFSELLQSSAMAAMPEGRREEYVELIHSSATHLLNVLNDILDMSKIEAGKYEILAEPFDIGQTIRASCAMLRGQAERKRIAMATLGLDDLPEMIADERAVKQIMINLVSNALKFTQDGGRVSVEAARVGRNVRISVSDNGIGIAPEHMELLGRPFYQADSRYDRKYQGTGLGLSVVRGLVELHRGKLAFASNKGTGTTVTVTLPICAQEPRPVPAQEEIEVVRLYDRREPSAGAPFAIAAALTRNG